MKQFSTLNSCLMCLTLIVLEIKNNGFIWIEIDKPTRDQMKKLAERFPFHELNLEDCLSKIQIPKIDRYEDHIDKVIDTLEESKETIEIYKDTDYLHGTDRSNKILAILTIVFTLSLPITIMSSLYGMNVDIPAIEDESLKFLGRYTTFILIVIGSSAGAVAMAMYFHKIKWI